MFFRTLTGRFILLSIIFVMVAEVFIFVPSVSRFREDYLRERLERAQIASLAILAAQDEMVSDGLEAELLDNVEVENIVLLREAEREIILASPMPASVDVTVDMRANTTWSLIRDAFDTILNGDDRIIRVVGEPVKGGGVLIEATMKEAPLRVALIDYGARIFWLSMVLSLFVASMYFFAIRSLIGQPIARFVRQIGNFKSAPEDTRQIIEPKAQITELFRAEEALADMETQLNASLLERKRLVALGGAVSKISHDLRNILTTAQLLADRVEQSDDPRVSRVAPRLVNSLSRAVNLADRTLSYGRAEEPAPELAKFAIKELIHDVVDAEKLAVGDATVDFEVNCPSRLNVWADREQLFRVVSNVVRNARQVLSARKEKGKIEISVSDKAASSWKIVIKDNGPGMPQKARTNMFKPFEGSARAGGTGLGLAIASELIGNHGGSLVLLYSGDQGTAFEISLPKEQLTAH